MTGNDMFDDLKNKLTQILDYAVITHDNCPDRILERRAVHLYVCTKSFLDQYHRVHQWYESARVFLLGVDRNFPGIREFAEEYQRQDHDDDDVEELVALLEEAEIEEDEGDDDVFHNDEHREDVVGDEEDEEDDGRREDGYVNNGDEDEEENLVDDLDFDQILAFFN